MKKLAIVILVLLAACSGGPTLIEGRIVDKDYDAPWEEYHPGYWSESCSGGYNGEPQRCTSWFNPGYTTYHPADYDLMVEGVNEKGETIREWWDVSSGTYEVCEIGQYINRETSFCSVPETQ